MKTINGEKCIVSPSVILRETVLPNSPNPQNPSKPVPHLIQKNEIEKSVNLWKGETITMMHPSQRSDVDIQSPSRLKRAISVGNVEEPTMDGDKLKALLIHKMTRLENVRFGPFLKNQIMSGRPVECSTGYIAEYRRAEPGSKHKGHSYVYTQHNIKPDHVADLPFGEGKCSTKDGCGLNQNIMIQNVLETGRVPDFEGTTSGDWSRQNLGDAIDGFLENADSDLDEDDLDRDDWGENPEAFRNWAAQKSILGSSDEDTYQRGTLWQVVNYMTEELNENALDAVISGRGEQTEGISDRTRTAGQGIARNLLEEEYDRDLPDEDETENVAQSIGRTVINKTMRVLNLHEPGECEPVNEDEPTENALLEEDDPASFAVASEAISVYENAGGDLTNSILSFKEWVQTRSEATAQELTKLRDAVEEFTQLTDNDFLGRVEVSEFQGFLSEQMSENPQSNSEEGISLAELSDEQEEALAELDAALIENLASLDPEQIQRLGELDTETVENAAKAAERQESERSELVESLVENEDTPYGDAEDLEQASMQQLKDIQKAYDEGSTENDDGSPHVANAGGGGGFQRNNGGPKDEDFEDLQPAEVATGGGEG